ncbi:MAG: GNAT family N-acetyltransferase [Clostridia bacterium]|nr:GNAT family N-acetyltransferase [Clostridia bacterium]
MAVRAAKKSDLDSIMAIIEDARRFMREKGVNQWQNGRPGRELFESDIEADSCFVCAEGDAIAGVISIFSADEPSYCVVYDGKWLTHGLPYAVFHRFAVSDEYRGKGIAAKLLSFSENYAKVCGMKSIRGDTHRDNMSMRGLLQKCGYNLCGTIHIDEPAPGDIERLCYEKVFEG